MNVNELWKQWLMSVEEVIQHQEETSPLEDLYNVAGIHQRSDIRAGIEFPPNDKYFTNQRGYWC